MVDLGELGCGIVRSWIVNEIYRQFQVELVLVKMDEDLFGAFEDDVREGAAEVGANPSNEDIMRKVCYSQQIYPHRISCNQMISVVVIM